MPAFRIFIKSLTVIQIGSLALLGLVMIVSWANRFTFPKRETAALIVIIILAGFAALERIKKYACAKKIRSQR